MFKSKKKKLQEKQQREAEKAAILAASESVNKLKEYKLLDDIKLSHDFRSSVIIPQLEKERKFNEMFTPPTPLSPTPSINEPPQSPTSPVGDASKQYKELANWRHQRNQNRYSNSLFGGKQRGRPTPSQLKKSLQSYDEEQDTITEDNTLVDEDLLIIPPSLNQIINDHEQEKQSYMEDHHNSTDEEDDDFEFEKDEYEPDSDEENFFFKDFSNDSQKPKQNTRRKRKSNKINNHQFNLSMFAKDLHDHRLSVIQPRQSRIVMTEDDEEELEQLLQLQRQRMSIMTINESTDSLNVPPPMPSLDIMKQYNSTGRDSPSSLKQEILRDAPKEAPSFTKKETVHLINKEMSIKKEPVQELPPIPKDASKETDHQVPSLALHKSSSFTKKDQAPIVTRDRSPSVKKDQTRVLNRDRSPSVKKDQTPIITTRDRSPSVKKDQVTIVTRERSPSVKKNQVPVISRERSHSFRKEAPIPSLSRSNDIHQDTDSNKIALDEEEDMMVMPAPLEQPIQRSISTASIKQTPRPSRSFDQRRQKARKSLSMDNIPFEQDASVTSAALDWIEGDTQKQAPISMSLKPKSRGLFGSLRQVSRSKTHHSGNHVNPIRGLVRNLSTNTHQQSPGMSRAAMAVIQHNVAQHEQKQSKNPKQADIISQFISRASLTKIVNMNEKEKRNQVVRRTIIYVQPDSLHQLLKNGGDGVNIPPVPNRNTVLSEESQDEYIKATKISRQTSVRKKVVENNQKRWQLQSMDEDDMLPPAQRPTSSSSSGSSSSSSDASYMEGVELREMSDGSVMWGIVKKQGNRKSFYAHKKDQFELVDEVELPTRPPPIPKRSPHRQPSSHKRKEETNIYYSNDVSLPNLLKMVNDQYPGDIYQSEKSMDSVDDQLDEMIKIISNQK